MLFTNIDTSNKDHIGFALFRKTTLKKLAKEDKESEAIVYIKKDVFRTFGILKLFTEPI